MPASTSNPMHAVAFGEVLAVMVQERPGPLESSVTFRRSMGGAEANVAIGLAAQGIQTTMLTKVGDDGFGRFLVSSLAARGIDVDAIRVDPDRSTGLYVKEVGGTSGSETDLGTGSSRMHYYRQDSAGAGIDLAYLRDPAVTAALHAADLVHISGITSALSASAAAAQRSLTSLVGARTRVAFDLNWRPTLWRGRMGPARTALGECMRSADVALTGLAEAAAVFGTTSPESIRAAFPQPRWLIVKNDGADVVAFEGDAAISVSAHRLDVVESIGAGDAFASGLLAGLLRSLPLRRAVEAGHDAAARVLTSTHDHVPETESAP